MSVEQDKEQGRQICMCSGALDQQLLSWCSTTSEKEKEKLELNIVNQDHCKAMLSQCTHLFISELSKTITGWSLI